MDRAAALSEGCGDGGGQVELRRWVVEGEQASGIVGMIVKDGPPFRQFTYTDAIGMPILYGARQVVIGSVG